MLDISCVPIRGTFETVATLHSCHKSSRQIHVGAAAALKISLQIYDREVARWHETAKDLDGGFLKARLLTHSSCSLFARVSKACHVLKAVPALRVSSRLQPNDYLLPPPLGQGAVLGLALPALRTARSPSKVLRMWAAPARCAARPPGTGQMNENSHHNEIEIESPHTTMACPNTIRRAPMEGPK